MPILGVCLNTSKAVKHTEVLWHKKSFVSLSLCCLPEVANWIKAEFWERDDCLGNNLVTRRSLSREFRTVPCIFLVGKKKKKKASIYQLKQLAVVWVPPGC